MNNKPNRNGLEFYSEKDLRSVSGRIKNKTQYRWRIYKQGRIIAASTEGYSRLIGAQHSVLSVWKSLGEVQNYVISRISEATENFKNSLKK